MGDVGFKIYLFFPSAAGSTLALFTFRNKNSAALGHLDERLKYMKLFYLQHHAYLPLWFA